MSIFSFSGRKFRVPRKWSNQELRKIAHYFTGEIINVSGWDDRDKEGGTYKGYFSGASAYYISNFRGSRGLDDALTITDFEIDLESDLPESLKNRFDVVFNHTTLEHVFDVFKAFKNICAMTRDVVIVVVPFTQQVHVSDSFSDYWRFTPHVLKRLFEHNSMHCIYIAANNQFNCSNYVIAVGSKNPEKWVHIINKTETNFPLSEWIGTPFFIFMLKRLFGFIKK
jgi:hypothetical protein